MPPYTDPDPPAEENPLPFMGSVLKDDDETPYSLDVWKEEGNSFGDLARAAGRQMILNSRQREQLRRRAQQPARRDTVDSPQQPAPQQTAPADTAATPQPQENFPQPDGPNITENDTVFYDEEGNLRGEPLTTPERRQQQGQTGAPSAEEVYNDTIRMINREVYAHPGRGQGEQQRGRGQARSGRGRTTQQSRRRSVQQLMDRTDPGPRSDYVQDASEQVVMIEPGASKERVQEVLDSGRIPIQSADLSGIERFEEIDVDFSRAKEAVEDFADAKVKAAKKGALATKVGAENANTRLMANALGPGLFQALTGTQQPTNQQSNYNARAARRVEEANKAVAQAEQVAETAPAQAEKEIADLDRQERQRQRTLDRQTKKLNDEQIRQEQKSKIEQQRQYVNTVTGLADNERQRMRKMLWQQEKKLMEEDPAINPNAIQTVRQINQDLADKEQKMRHMNEAVSILRNSSNYSQEQQEQAKQFLAQNYGIGDGGFMDFGTQKSIDQIQDRIASIQADYESLRKKKYTITSGADRGAFGGAGYGTLPGSSPSGRQNVNTQGSILDGSPETPGGGEEDPTTPENTQDNDETTDNTDETVNEFQRTFGHGAIE